ncbi:hypothetical protein ABEV15_11375 [Bhargavaea massiliensis]
MYNTPWRDKEWFTKQFIYIGKSIHELSIELGMDWSSLERWRQIHGLPKHSEKEKIIEEYGLDVFENVLRVIVISIGKRITIRGWNKKIALSIY